MKLEVVGEHTVDVDLLAGGFVLDAGCRDFTFARELARRGCRVVALDPDPTVDDPKIEGVDFQRQAIAEVSGLRQFVMTVDPQARYLAPVDGRMGNVTVDAISLVDLMRSRNVETWDAVKLDVEGAEYDVLRTWPGPVARQISVEFHEHVCPRSSEVYEAIFAHLGQWYRVVQHEKTARYCAGYNYWDSLFVLVGV